MGSRSPNGFQPKMLMRRSGLTKTVLRMPSGILTASDMILPMIIEIGSPLSQRSIGSVATLRQCGSSRPEMAHTHFWNPPPARQVTARRSAWNTSLWMANTRSVTVDRMLEGHGRSQSMHGGGAPIPSRAVRSRYLHLFWQSSGSLHVIS